MVLSVSASNPGRLEAAQTAPLLAHQIAQVTEQQTDQHSEKQWSFHLAGSSFWTEGEQKGAHAS